jgi:ubiquinone biosynthesis monooxygenase Coq7
MNALFRNNRVLFSLLHARMSSTFKMLTKKEKQTLDHMLRVNHAGEYGANRIYAGQMAILGKSDVGPIIQKMWDQEKAHLQKFNEMLPDYHVRPTFLLPFWNVAGFALGAGTAILGKEAAMASTVAVETAITNHYNDQLRELFNDDPVKYKEIMSVLKTFRDDEIEHHDIGLEHDAEKALAYKPLSQIIQIGCKCAIWLSERI